MLVFLDTEFTNFIRPDLISLALVSEDGREFYAERTDYHRDACSAFVRENVVPILGRVLVATCSRAELTQRLHEWFEQLPEPATIIYDFEGDWLLLAGAILGRAYRNPPPPILAHRCTWRTPVSRTRYLRGRKTSCIARTGPHTMRWPMHGG